VVGAAVGSEVGLAEGGATVGGGIVTGGALETVSAVGTGVETAVSDAPGDVGVAAPAEASAAATGIWSPPRAATKLMATTAHPTRNTTEATTAGVTVRRSARTLGSCTSLPRTSVRLAADSSTFSPWPCTSGGC
jgi:hypothetical protein